VDKKFEGYKTMTNTKVIIEAVVAIMMVAGTAIGVVAYRVFAQKRRQLAECYRTTGEVIDVKDHPGGEYGPKRHPVVKFMAENGEAVIFESSFGAENWNVKRGDQLMVAANRHNPSDAQVVNFAAQWGKPLLLMIIALSIIQGALILFFIFVK
jgi:cytochrome c oxidase assembly protein Cox11